MSHTNGITSKQRRDRFKRKGLCTKCGGEREIAERRYCQKCTDINRAYRVKK